MQTLAPITNTCREGAYQSEKAANLNKIFYQPGQEKFRDVLDLLLNREYVNKKL